jgi:hypothetical protein
VCIKSTDEGRRHDHTTSLQHPNLRAKLHGAMIRAAAASRVMPNGAGMHTVGNIDILHFRGNKAATSGFAFMVGLDDITATVLAALRAE